MSVKLTTRQVGDVTVVDVAGRITLGEGSSALRDVLRETLGQDWLTPDLFRIGASRLANDLLMQIVKERTGAYQSLDYFSKD